MITNYIVSIFLIALGFYCCCVKKNLIKVVLGLGIVDYGINLLIVSTGFRSDATAPIYEMGDLLNGVAASYFVDPIPQALTLTSIVIGACVDAMALAFVVMIHRKYGSVDTDKVRRLHG